MVLAPAAFAQTAAPAAGSYKVGTPFEGDVRMGYRWVTQEGSPMSGEYEYLHSSAGGSAMVEYDPLPNRFLLEMHALNDKDYFGELDYSYGDVFMMNGMARSLFHNLFHYSLGQDDPSTPSPVFQDYPPFDT